MAKDAEDFERVLDYFAKEKRSGYWREIKGLKLLVYYLYDLLSNYGRSVFRPLVALVLVWGVFSVGYWQMSGLQKQCFGSQRFGSQLSAGQSSVMNCASLHSAMSLSISHSIPILTGVKTAREDSLKRLFPSKQKDQPYQLPGHLHFITFLQNVLAGVCLFLLGLGLRNRFKT